MNSSGRFFDVANLRCLYFLGVSIGVLKQFEKYLRFIFPIVFCLVTLLHIVSPMFAFISQSLHLAYVWNEPLWHVFSSDSSTFNSCVFI